MGNLLVSFVLATFVAITCSAQPVVEYSAPTPALMAREMGVLGQELEATAKAGGVYYPGPFLELAPHKLVFPGVPEDDANEYRGFFSLDRASGSVRRLFSFGEEEQSAVTVQYTALFAFRPSESSDVVCVVLVYPLNYSGKHSDYSRVLLREFFFEGTVLRGSIGPFLVGGSNFVWGGGTGWLAVSDENEQERGWVKDARILLLKEAPKGPLQIVIWKRTFSARTSKEAKEERERTGTIRSEFELTAQEYLVQRFDEKAGLYSAPLLAPALPPPPRALWDKAPGATLSRRSVEGAIE